MVRPSCAALSRSISMTDCGKSYLRSVSKNMNMPLLSASSRNARDTSFKRSAGSVVLMANCTGKPKAPGSEGSSKDRDLLRPATELRCLLQAALDRGRAGALRRSGVKHQAVERLVGRLDLEDVLHAVFGLDDLVRLGGVKELLLQRRIGRVGRLCAA